MGIVPIAQRACTIILSKFCEPMVVHEIIAFFEEVDWFDRLMCIEIISDINVTIWEHQRLIGHGIA